MRAFVIGLFQYVQLQRPSVRASPASLADGRRSEVDTICRSRGVLASRLATVSSLLCLLAFFAKICCVS